MSTSPITAAKNAQGHVSAQMRKRCGTCQHVAHGRADAPMQCRKGGFMTSAWSICEQWQIIQPPGYKAPTTKAPA